MTNYGIVISAGSLHHRVTYQVRTYGTPSALGDSAEIYSTTASLWASVEELSGTELWRAHEVHEECEWRVIIRYNSIVTTNGRFVFEGQYLYPLSVISDDLKRMMTVLCKSRPEDNT